MTRMLIARILVVLATLFAVVGLLAGYVRYQALDNETFSNTAADLITDDEVRDQIGLSLVDALYSNVDVAAALEARLPPDQKALAGPIAAATRALADRAAARVLERPRAQELWVRSLTTTHEQLLRVLNDDLTNVQTEGGVVVLNLRPLVVQLGDQVAIVGRVAERLPADAGRIEIMDAKQLETAQDVTSLLDTLGRFIWFLPLGARRARDLARGRPTALDRPVARHRGDRRRLAGPRRPQRRRQLHRRQPRQDGVGEAGCERHLGHPHRASPRRSPDAPRSRDRAPGRRLARRARRQGNGSSGALGAVARAPGDRLRRRRARAGAARLVGADGADPPLAGHRLLFAVLLGLGVAALARAARADQNAVGGPGDAPTPLPPPA